MAIAIDSRAAWGNARLAVVIAALGAPALGWAQAEGPNPATYRDDTWITLSGTVEALTPDGFALDYGEGEILVEVDERDVDLYRSLEGEEVTVNGVVDDDFLDSTSIEASNVFVHSTESYLIESPRDEEAAEALVALPISSAVLQGRVTEVNDDALTVDTGSHRITITVDTATEGPRSEQGEPVEVGDVVRVETVLDRELFEARVLEARAITIVSAAAG